MPAGALRRTVTDERAIEMNSDVVIKATKVEGVFDKDPAKHDDAKLFHRLTYDRVLADRLGVMDSTAITLCRDNGLPIRVCSLKQHGNVKRIVQGEDVGTLVTEEG